MFDRMRANTRWVLMFWIFVMSAIAYLDRVNIAIAGHSMALEFHLSNIQLGWIFSAFVLGYALFQAPCGRLADRLGARRVLAGGVVWWALFTSLTASVPATLGHALFLLLGVRFCLGAGEAVVYPASNRFVASWIPTQERGIANGLIFAGVGIGAGITPPLITWIMLRDGWRWSFWASALLGLTAGAVWYLIARDSPDDHPWTSQQERRLIRDGIPAVSPLGSRAVPWRKIIADRNVMAITFSYFCYGYAAYIFFSWFFIYLSTVRGLNIRSSSYYTMLPFLAMAIGSPVGGWISDLLTRSYGHRVGRCGIAIAGIGLAAIFIALGTQVESARLASVVLAGGAGALYLSQSSFWTVTADLAGPSAGSVSGIMNMGGQLGGALTASLTPMIAAHFGWTASFLAAAALCAVGSLAWIGVRPDVGINAEQMAGTAHS